MKTWIDRLLIVGLTIVIVVLTATSLPALFGGELGGPMLLVHMMASGALVFALPIFALIWTWRNISRHKSGGIQRLGYWTLILSGLATITTVFLCMLPYPSTDQMHQLIHWHGYAGFAMLPTLVLFLLGTSRWRRMHEMRSETLG